MLKYSRVLLKLSGEFFVGECGDNLSLAQFDHVVQIVTELLRSKVQVGIVVGGGNVVRGIPLAQQGFERITADYMGMLATVINSKALYSRCKQAKVPACLMSLITMPDIVACYDVKQAIQALQQYQLVIFAGGTGKPLCSTDSAASHRAVDIEADIVFKATKVDGVYAADPQQYPDARYYQHLSYDEVITKQLAVMDLQAFSYCRDHHMPIRIFNMNIPNVLTRLVSGDAIGTLIDSGEQHDRKN